MPSQEPGLRTSCGEQANIEKSNLEDARQELAETIATLELREEFYLRELDVKQAEIEAHLAEITQLKDQFKRVTLGTLSIVGGEDIAQDFKETYDFQDASIKVRDFPIVDPATGKFLLNQQDEEVTEPYLTVPVDYIKEVVLAKKESEKCQQVAGLQNEVMVLQQDQIRLNEEIALLKEEKAQQFAKAYGEACASFSTIHKNYVDLLNAPPKVDLAPRWLQLIGGAVGGALLCSI